MEYKRIDNTIIARIDRGESIVEKIQKIATAESIKTAQVSGIGAASHLEIGCYQVSEKQYIKHVYDGDFEITSLLGNISQKDGEFYLHLHINAADEKGTAYTGHFNEGIIGGTCELFINIIDTTVERQYDDETGLNVFKF